MSYSFWCSKCKFDHAGECKTLVGKVVDAVDGNATDQMIERIKELVKALEAGGLQRRSDA